MPELSYTSDWRKGTNCLLAGQGRAGPGAPRSIVGFRVLVDGSFERPNAAFEPPNRLLLFDVRFEKAPDREGV